MEVRKGRTSASPSRAPDPPQQVFVGHHPAGVHREFDEQTVLDCSQVYRLACKRHEALGVVDCQVPQDIGHLRLGHSASAKRRPDAGHKLGRREGFDDVVVRSHLEGPGDEPVLAVSGHEYYRHVSRGHDVLHQVDPVDSRQHQVEEDQMGPFLFHEAQPIFRVTGCDHRVARLDQGVPDVPERLQVVVHRQNAHLFPAPTCVKVSWRAEGMGPGRRILRLPPSEG